MKKKKYSFSKKKTVNTSSYEYVLASRYAKHMGQKFGLSPKEVRANTLKHYHEARSNPKFFVELVDNYGSNSEVNRKRY